MNPAWKEINRPTFDKTERQRKNIYRRWTKWKVRDKIRCRADKYDVLKCKGGWEMISRQTKEFYNCFKNSIYKLIYGTMKKNMGNADEFIKNILLQWFLQYIFINTVSGTLRIIFLAIAIIFHQHQFYQASARYIHTVYRVNTCGKKIVGNWNIFEWIELTHKYV